MKCARLPLTVAETLPVMLIAVGPQGLTGAAGPRPAGAALAFSEYSCSATQFPLNYQGTNPIPFNFTGNTGGGGVGENLAPTTSFVLTAGHL